MRQQEHIMHSTEIGVAVKCPLLPTWVIIFKYPQLLQNTQLFFNDFLQKYPEPLIGVVADEKTALICAQVYGKPFNKREMVAYYLNKNINITGYTMGNNRNNGLKICKLTQTQDITDIKLVQKWIRDFYIETLNVNPPSFSSQESNKKNSQNLSKTQIYLLKDNHKNETMAMGMLSGDVDHICRINLIYTPPHLRGKGYGKQMVHELASIVQYEKKTPMLYTTTDNIIANKLYQSLGFIKAGQLTEILFL